MSKMRRLLNNRGDKKQIARTTRLSLAFLITFLIAIILALIFRVGQVLWPVWMIEYRTQIIGIISLALLVVIVSSPVIVEVNSNPRHLSGPGKNPEQGWGP